jgi:inner membrane protein
LDSISQAALGAAVGVAVMGRSQPLWRSALAGAIVGTLPDLDVLIDKGDPVRNMVLHRAETHAFFWQALAAPLIAGVLVAVERRRDLFLRTLLAVLAILFTHALLDAVTVYGTRLGLPFTDHPFGLGALYIVDPLYTLPLLLGVLLALRGDPRRGWRRNAAGLAFSTLYVGWAIAAQAHVTGVARSSAEAAGLPPERILVTPAPLNTVLWRIVLVHHDHYQEGYYSLLDRLADPGRPIRFVAFPRGGELETVAAQVPAARLLADFSHGFYALSDDNDALRITDLRMGQHPHYVFSFVVAEYSSPVRPIEPRLMRQRVPLDPGLGWLWRRILGEDIDPPR